MRKIKVFTALCSALVICASAVSCGKKDSKTIMDTGALPDEYYVSDEELPYGATLTELKAENNDNTEITTVFDNRYFTDEEIFLVSRYIYALGKDDAELMSEVLNNDIMTYTYTESGKESFQDYLDEHYANLKELLGGDFEFSYIDISDCIREGDEGMEDAFVYSDKILDAATGESKSESVTMRKEIMIGGYSMYTSPDGTSQMLMDSLTEPLTLFIYELDGELFII